MQIKLPRLFLFILLLAGLVSLPLAQGEETDISSSDPIQRALQIVRSIIEEERGSPLRIARWRFFQDDWSTRASWQQYGSFGIDNCVSDVLTANKRNKVLFGWTFTITGAMGKRYQARVSLDLKDSALCDEVTTPAPAAAAPAAAAPVAGTASIEGFALGGQVTGLTPTAADLMRSAGMTWVKSQLPYSAGIDKGRQWIADAHAKGFKILLSVKGDHNALETNFDGYVKDFSNFLAKLAGAGANAIEVWNEPNLDREWPAGEINGGNYVKLLAPAYNAIKAANPSTIVISAAPAPTGYAGAAGCTEALCNDDVFMQQMAEAGAARYMDCLGLHYNEGITSPRANSGDPRPYYPTYYFSSMLNRGARFFPGKQVCWTELGYLSGEGMGRPIPGPFAWAGNVTVAQQAQWIAEAAALSAQSDRVALMIVWNVNFTRWGDDPMGGYALIRPDGSCPGCSTLHQVMRG